MKIFYLLLFLPLYGLFLSEDVDTNLNIGHTDHQPSEWIINAHPEYAIDFILKEIKNIQGIELIYKRRISQNMELHLVSYSGDLSEDQLKKIIFQSKYIHTIEKNAKVEFRDTRPDDFFYGSEQTNMEIIEAPKLWDLTTGGTTPNGDQIVVAVIDGSFEFDHPDLAGNLWAFIEEIDGNGIDDDGNGYVDDVHGWNGMTLSPIVSIRDDHGTGVAGIVGASGNNGSGVTGISWDVKFLPVSIGDSPDVESIIASYDYVLNQRKLYTSTDGEKGAYIVATNSSFGSNDSRPSDFPSWCAFYNMLGDAGVLNISASTNNNVDVEASGDIPTLCASDKLITVNNTDLNDQFSASGFGTESVDLSAPGTGVFTTTFDGNYAVLGGTSSSAPHVAGAVGLLYSLPCDNLGRIMKSDPVGFNELVKNAILENVDPLTSLTEKNATGGRLNVFKAAQQLLKQCDEVLTNGDYALGEIYPNPLQSHEQLTIRYQNENTDETCIGLYDGLGHFIRSYITDPIIVGKKEFIIEGLTLPAGVYFLRYPCENPKLTRSIIVQ